MENNKLKELQDADARKKAIQDEIAEQVAEEINEINRNIVSKLAEAPTKTKEDYVNFVVTTVADEIGNENIADLAIKLLMRTFQSKSLEFNKKTAEVVKLAADMQKSWSEIGKINNTFYRTTAQNLLKTEEIPGFIGSIDYEVSLRKVESLRAAARANQVLKIVDDLKEPKMNDDGSFPQGAGWSGLLVFAMPTPDGLSFRYISPSELTPLAIREDVAFVLPPELLTLTFNGEGLNFRRVVAGADKGFLSEKTSNSLDILGHTDKIDEYDFGLASESKREKVKDIITQYERQFGTLRAINIEETLRSVKLEDEDEARNIEISDISMVFETPEFTYLGKEDRPLKKLKFVKIPLSIDTETEDVIVGQVETDNGMEFDVDKFEAVVEKFEDWAYLGFESMKKSMKLEEGKE